ncbi:MAG TPA: CD225/dispanin family protein [Candidatus Mediterraneibacter excrementavium]|nr:CD225/dispanin family protein [Candidatus Mediterraneibacter excrementavium]
MNCIKCYQEIPDGSKFCPYCGAHQPEGPAHVENDATASAAQQTETAAAQETVTAAAQETENTAQQPETVPVQETENTAQEAAAPVQEAGNTAQQNGPVYQSEPVYQSPVQPQAPINGTPYLVLSIVLAVLSALCCCNILSLAFSIVAIVYSSKIGKCVNEGDYAAAAGAAKTAKIWIIVAFAVGIVGTILSIVALGGLTDLAYYYY